MDKNYFDSLKYYINGDITDEYLFFSVERDFFGRHEEIDLTQDGKDVPVTNENKLDYLERISFYEMYDKVKQQV